MKSSWSIFFLVAYAKKTLPNPKPWGFTPMFSPKSSIVLALIFRYLIHFELGLYIVWDECPPSYFHMWMSSCLYTICWKDCSFPIFTFVFEKYFQIISKQFFFSFFPYLKDFASLSSGLILTFVPLYVLFSLMDLHNFIKIYPGVVFVMFLVLEVHWDSWMCGPKVFIKFGKFMSIISFKNFFAPPSFRVSNYMYISPLEVVP